MDEVERVREGVAKAYGIQLYKLYSEPEAAHFIGIHHDSLKEMRRDGKTPYVNLGPRKKRYLGIHIVDLIAFGEKWPDMQKESSKSAPTGLASGQVVSPTTGLGSTAKPNKPDAFHLVQATLRKPSGN